MAAQVEVQTGEVGRPVAGGRLHLSPLTDSSNKTVETPQITQSHIITPEPSKPAPGPKPRLTPKPFAVEKNPTIKPILAPKPQPKPRPESTRPAGSRLEFPGSSKPQQPVPTGKPKLVSTNPNRPAPTTFKTSNNWNTGQTIKPAVQPFKPVTILDAEELSKPTPPVPAIRKNTGPRSLAYSKSLKKFPVAEWPRTTKREDEKVRGTGNGGAPMTRAKSMGSLNQVGQEEEEEKEKAVASVPLRPQTKTSRPRPVSALFLDNPSKTETPVPAPRRGGRRPLSADLTSKFESIGLSLHRKSPKANAKEDAPEEETLSETKTCPDDASNSFTPADQSDINTGKTTVKDTENKHGGSIKSRISLLLDSSSCPSAGAAGQGSDLNSPVQVAPEPEPPVGVKRLIKQLTEDVLPTPSPIMKPALKPRPLPLDLTKRFSTERSPDLGSTSLSEAIDRHEISKDPQWMTEASPVSHSDQWIMDLTDSREQLKWASTPESMRTFTPEESGPAAELQTVRASLFENVVERHSVLVVDDAKPAKKDFLSSSSFKRKSSEDDGTLLTATYKEPAAPSGPLCVVHAFDSVQAVVSEAVSENIPAAQWEDKAMTLRSRRSEGSRNEMTASGYRDPALAATPEPHPRYLRVGALHKWTTTSFDTHAGMSKETLQEENVNKDRDKPKEAEKEEVLGETKRLKRHTEEQPKPKATYFALTAQIQDNVSPVDSGATKGGGISPFDPMSSLLGSSQGKILSVRRNPSLDEALGKTFASQDQVEDSVMRSRMSHKEIRSPSDGQTAEEMMEVEKNIEAKMKELESEKPRQPVLEQQAQFAKMKEIEMQREFVRQRQKERKEDEERERERQKEREKARKQEKERQRQREEERQRELDRQNHLLELQLEKQKREELELERQRLLEFEKQKQKEKERQRAMELEQQVQRELERQRQRDLERERQRKELERQLEFEKQKQKEKERQQAMELEQQVQREKLERERAEKLKQAALEQEMLRLREIEKERERQMEMEKERQKELDLERQRELERQRQKALERERQRQLDIERQELENQRLRQEELEKERQRKELERQQRLEFEMQKQKEKERQQAMELEQREREKLERERAEKLKQAALEQEMLRLREIEKEKERQVEMEKERQKELELERQRQKALERDRQRQLDIERQALENQRLRQEELEKERQRKELEAMERRRLLEFEKQRQAEELERRLREEAEKLRQVAKQQEAERRRMREKQERRSESSPLRPKVMDPDAPLRNEPQAAPQRSDPSTRWKEPSPRADEPYKPAILDIDSFPSQTQLPPSKDPFALSNVQSVDSALGSKSQHTPERDVSWKVPPPTSGGFSSPIWTPPQDPWQLWSNELSVDRPTAEPRKPASRVGPEQLLLRQEELQPAPQRRPAVPDELLLFDPLCPTKTGSPPSAGASSSLAAEMTWLPKEPPRQDSRAEVPKPRRSQGSQDSRMRSRSMCRRSAPSTSASEGNLPRIRSRSAHREQDRHSWVQEKQSDKDEKEGKGSETPVHDTDSQYGTWETGLRTDDSLTPATPTSDSNLSPSPRKPPSSGERGSQSETDTLDGLLPSPANQPLSFPDAPSTLLDNSVLRTRAQLAKKRAPRTRPSRAARQSAALAGEGGSGDDWLYRDSTEAKVESKNDDSDSEEQNKDADVGAAVASQPQRVALFPGVDPSALKAQLRKRGDSDTQTDGSTPSPSQPSRSPKSPFLPRAARVLPTPGGKESGEEDSPQWLKELKSKKRLSQYESES